MLRMGGCTSPPGALRAPTSPLRGEATPPHLAGRAPRADLPTAWGGEHLPTWLRALRAPTSPLRGEATPPHLAARAPRADLPTWLRALRAPTSPRSGEATAADLPVEIG
ncbi:MAG TPA: hypothetical protein VGA76_04875 [Candidatus Dormibacteraeota bacterium]